MATTITLKYSGYCQDCSAPLPVGTKAKWYGRGKVYGIECHAPKPLRDAQKALEELVLDREAQLRSEEQLILNLD